MDKQNNTLRPKTRKHTAFIYKRRAANTLNRFNDETVFEYTERLRRIGVLRDASIQCRKTEVTQ